MATNREIIIALDNFRLEKRKTIQDMTEGIISPRNYSRLLKDEAEITMDVLVALLDKLNTPFEEFISYINMHKYVDSFDEDRFVYLVIFENYEKAVSKYSDVMSGKNNKSRFAEKTIPACVAYLSYINKKITLQAAKMLIEGFLDLNTIEKNKVIHEEDIYTMYLYMKIASQEELDSLSEFMNTIIYDRSFKVFAHQYENTIMMAYIIEMYLLTSKPYSVENDKAIRNVFKEALLFNSKYTISPFDVLLFEVVFKYVKKNDIKSKYISFYYIASVLSTSNVDFLRGRTFDIGEDDLEAYYGLISDARFVNSHMYKRLINEL